MKLHCPSTSISSSLWLPLVPSMWQAPPRINGLTLQENSSPSSTPFLSTSSTKKPPSEILHHSPNQEKVLVTSCATTFARENTTSPPRIGNTTSTSLTAGLPNREKRQQLSTPQSSSISVQRQHHEKSKIPQGDCPGVFFWPLMRSLVAIGL